jgi:hypothetical protein
MKLLQPVRLAPIMPCVDHAASIMPCVDHSGALIMINGRSLSL